MSTRSHQRRDLLAPAAQGRPPSSLSSSESPFDLVSKAEVELDELYRDTDLEVVGLDRHSDDLEPSSPRVTTALDSKFEFIVTVIFNLCSGVVRFHPRCSPLYAQEGRWH